MSPAVGLQEVEELSPDQQAQLTQGQTPSRILAAGELMRLFPREEYSVTGSDGRTWTYFGAQMNAR